MKTWSLGTKILTFSLILFSAAFSAAGQKTSVPSLISSGQPDASDKAPQATLSESGSDLHKREWRYRVHPSDILELTFKLTPEFNQTVTVQPDGNIALRDIGDLKVAGQTLPELIESIKAAYSKILLDPMISVDPKDFEKPYFVVDGQVGKPGKFDWRGDVTLTQAIAIAGGFTDNAKHSQVLLFRRVSDEWAEAKLINVKQMLHEGNLREDPILQPGDMLYVPKNMISKIKPWIPTTGLYSSFPLP